MTLRIAMWSGPRNISTAMMRSFSSRPDCFVSDEPFYGAFLKASGADHPMRDEIIATMETDWQRVAVALAGDPPDGAPIWYQKQMAHHMVGPMAPDDLNGATHAFLIRDPARMAASYAKKRESVSADDLGVTLQRQFFDREADRLGKAPPVIDAADVLGDPAGTLSALCAALGIDWTDAMLRWTAGRHPEDGAWAAHWYGHVERSTGFEGEEQAAAPQLDDRLQAVADACHDDYAAMAAHRLRNKE
jgi:hypothetical protein